MDVFGTLRPAGLNLGPYAKADFEHVKGLIDTATSEMLIAPDWDTIMNIVDALNNQRDPTVIAEMFFYIRKKLVARNPRIVAQALTLSEALVKNCGAKAHRAVNDEAFMKTIERVARHFSERSRKERNREVSEVVEQVLDLVQTWGEAFLPHRSRYPNICEAYFNLRKEGMPFKAQFDESRAPVFTPDVSVARNSFDGSADAELARAMQASMNLGGDASVRQRATSYSQYSSDDVLPVVAAAVEMLTSALDGASAPADVKNNEVIREIVQQCEQLQAPLASLIERSITEESSTLEELFALNDSLQSAIQRFKDALQGKMQPPASKRTTESVDLLGDPGLTSQSAAPAPVVAAAAGAAAAAAPGNASQYDPFGFGAPPPAAAAPAPPVVQATAVDDDPLAAFLSGPGHSASKPTAAPSPTPVKLAPPPTDASGRPRRRTRSGDAALDIFGSQSGTKQQEQQAAAAAMSAPAAADPFAALDAIASRHSSVPGTTNTASTIDFLSMQPTQASQPHSMTFPPQQQQQQPMMSMPSSTGAYHMAPQMPAQQQQMQASSNPFDDLLGMSAPQQQQQQPMNYHSQHRNTPF